MMIGWLGGKRALLAVAVLATAGLATPDMAEARRRRTFTQRNASRATCPPSKDLVDVDTRVCPANQFRPPVILQRACCQGQNGKVKCRNFMHCPKRSPS